MKTRKKLSGSEDQNGTRPSRRQFVTGGALALLAPGLLGEGFLAEAGPVPLTTKPQRTMPLAAKNLHNLVLDKRSSKPTYLPLQNTQDAAVMSLADNLFWVDIMMEHAKFFTLLMPGPELAGPRSQAEKFNGIFLQHLNKMRAVAFDGHNYQSINQVTINLVKPFIDFKLKMRELQMGGKLRSLVWPLFFEHTAHEAKRFVNRLENLSAGNPQLEQKEVIEFWTEIMSEHAQFIAHLLDPTELELINKANATAQITASLHENPDIPKLMNIGEEIIDFKMAAEKGILTGQIQSIINPALADHVLREAIKYVDELKRVI